MTQFLVNTAEEFAGTSEAKTTGILFFVLSYDDLLAASTLVLPPLAQDGSSFFIDRASEPGPPKLDTSDPNNKTLLLADAFISRKRARFIRHADADFVEDLGSKHGTFVNGEPISGAYRLEDGDFVEIGHSLFVYRYVESSIAARSVVQRQGLSFGPTHTFCPELMTLTHRLRKVAASEESVLILGETGTGKEIAARFVHEKSQRKGPLVSIDCGAIPPHLVEGELFGHKRGAFSGASENRLGRLRSAQGGTVFLDEIGNLPEIAQTSLLRVLQEREVLPIGGDRAEPLDVRFIAATNADISDKNTHFRADLRIRLAGCIAHLPRLRDRREDLGVLTAFFLQELGAKKASITKRAARLLFGGALAGNVRELRQALRSGAILAEDEAIDVDHLSALQAQPRAERVEPPKQREQASRSASAAEEDDPVRRKRPSYEVLAETLTKTGGNQHEAAKLLGVSPRQLARWMDDYGLTRARH